MNVITYLEDSAVLRGNRTAVSIRDESFSFEELLQKTRALSSAIDINYKNKTIVVFANRKIDTLIFFFATVYSGNFYIPVDPTFPIEKINSIIYDAEPKYIFADVENQAVLSQLDFKGTVLNSLSYGSFYHDPKEIKSDAPLYVVYTSGSTGKPKGVIKTHAAVINFIESYCNQFEFDETDIIGNQSPFFFDASAKDIYLMLKTGARLEIIPNELFVIPPRLLSYLNDKKITFVSWVPTVLALVSQMKAFKYVKPKYLKKVFFVGEVMPVKHLNYWIDNLADVKFVNLYGQSEIAGIACFYEVCKKFDEDKILPIGRPLDNCEILLRDGENFLHIFNEVGEIWIESKALASGYYHDVIKTEDAFVVEAGHRYFRTGDYAYMDECGQLIFTARRDSQIKHMGRRIELGEIEAIAGSIDNVERVCCMYDSENKKIVMFCQGEIEEKEFKKTLREKISSYMLPGRFFFMNRLPINANGKIDRQKLKEML